MDELRKEFEYLLGYKPHHRLWEAKLREKIEQAKAKSVIPVVVDVPAPPIEPLTIEDWITVPSDNRTPEQIEEDIITNAIKTVPEFIPEPEEIRVSDEQYEKIKETQSENPLMTAMTMLLNSQSQTNELLKQMNDKLGSQSNVPVEQLVTPPEALKNLTQAQLDSPLPSRKIFKILILKIDLQATDWGQERSETWQIFQTREEAEEFWKKYAPWLTTDWAPRYRIYHETIILPSNQKLS
jgi:hypothetical protein